jgi:hypothetical protein
MDRFPNHVRFTECGLCVCVGHIVVDFFVIIFRALHCMQRTSIVDQWILSSIVSVSIRIRVKADAGQ